MAHAHTTFANLKTQLADRLGDPSKLWWRDAELGHYIQEALQVWQVFSLYHSSRITTLLSTAPIQRIDTLTGFESLAHTYSDRNLLLSLQYPLLSQQSLTSWPGLDQFTIQEVTEALNRRLQQFVNEVGMVCDYTTQVVGAPPEGGRVFLPDTITDIRRLGWQTIEGALTFLRREDEWTFNSFLTDWSTTPGTPQYYSTAITYPLVIQLAPIPQDTGTLRIIYVPVATDLHPALSETLIDIPNDYVWILKYGTIAELIGRPGPAHDPQRAAYCEQRWREGISLARVNSHIITAEINGVPTPIIAGQDLDDFTIDWDGTSGLPNMIGMYGWNVMMFSPKPDAQYSLTLDAVTNFPIPILDAEFVQIERSLIGPILDYAHHAAAFKQGGAEFSATQPGYDSLVRQASIYNDKLRAIASNFDALSDRSLEPGYKHPRLLTDIVQSPGVG